MPIRTKPTKRQVRDALRMYSASAPDRARAAAADDLFGLERTERTRAPSRKIEHGIQAAIIDYLLLHGWAVLRLNSLAARTDSGGFVRGYSFRAPGIPTMTSGMPDILAWRGGVTLSLEVKQPGAKGTEAQLLCLNTLRKAGCKAAVVDSVEMVAAIIRDI